MILRWTCEWRVPQRKRWFDLDHPDAPEPQVAIVGAPYDGSASLRAGAALAPDRLRMLSHTSDAITRRGHDLDGLVVRDFGDAFPTTAQAHQPQAQLLEAARNHLLNLPSTDLTILIGGDNSVSIAGLDAFVTRHGRDVGVVWFDAHPDLFERYDNNPLSHASALRTPLERNDLDPSKVVLLGTRSFAREELAFIREHDVRMITAAEWSARATNEVFDTIHHRISECSAIYLAIDIDGFDASAAPGTGYPMPGGVATERVFDLLDHVFEACPVRALDVTEVAPPLDVGDQTTFLALQVLLEALSHLRRIPHFQDRK